MKHPNRLVPFLLLAVLALPLVNCSKKNSPMAPVGPATPTPGPGFTWNIAEVYRVEDLGVITDQADVNLTLNGAAVSTVGVTLTGSGLSSPVPLAFSGLVTNGSVYASYMANGFLYGPGETMVLTTRSGPFSAAATLTAPGNITNVVDGSQVYWTYGGSQNQVAVRLGTLLTYDSSVYSATVISPFTIPVTAYLGGGIFTLTTSCANSTTQVAGTTSASYKVSDTLVSAITLDTDTPTQTPSATDTPTPTDTPTVTNTPTDTETETSTPTDTPTP